MKHRILFFVCMICIAPLLVGTEELSVIENLNGPVNKSAGRIVKLTEVMRISGEHDNFFFKRPSKIQIAPDDSIFLIDKKQFLRFDKSGRFLGNLHKVGEGPGETAYIRDYFFSKKGILIFSSRPPKIIETDLAGHLLKEYRIENKMGFKRTIGLYNGRYWSAFSGYFDSGKKATGIADIKLKLGWETIDGKADNTNLVFTEKAYFSKRTIGNGVRTTGGILVPAIFAMDRNGNIFVSDSREYSIKRVSLEKEKIVGKFTRKYPRVPYREETDKKGKRSKSLAPPPKFFNDIQKLLFHKESLWILTSSIVKGKGIMVDVFSKDGQYTDSFFLDLPQVDTIVDLKLKSIAVNEDYLITVEKDEEENPYLIKYVLEL